jgi:Fe-S cluster assembly iron-binding protein IscA
MIEVTEKASEKLKQYMDDKQIESAIRIYVSHVG